MSITEPTEPTGPRDAARDDGALDDAGGGPVVVRSSTPEDLLALAAHTLGFWPSESLVMISLRGPRLRSGLVARVDLDAYTRTAEERSSEEDGGVLDHLVDQLLPAMVRDGARAVAVLLCSDVTSVSVAHAAVVASAQRVIARHDLELVDAVLLGADRRWSLTCTDDCCPPEGVPVDLRASRVAAEGVLAGSAPARTRDELLAEHLDALEPVAGTEAAVAADAVARHELAARSAFGLTVRLGRVVDDAGPAQSVLALWWRLLHACPVPRGVRREDPPMTPEEGAVLLVGLTDLLVRDALMVSLTMTGPRRLGLVGADGADGPHDGADGPELLPRDRRSLLDAVTASLSDSARTDHPGDDALSERAAEVLTALARTAPRHLRAGPLALLAYVHWWRANTLAAEAAAEAAVAADPEHSLGELVTALLARGVAPDWLPRGGASPAPGGTVPTLRRAGAEPPASRRARRTEPPPGRVHGTSAGRERPAA